jgi:hypothetical protein
LCFFFTFLVLQLNNDDEDPELKIDALARIGGGGSVAGSEAAAGWRALRWDLSRGPQFNSSVALFLLVLFFPPSWWAFTSTLGRGWDLIVEQGSIRCVFCLVHV